jgi:rhamnopyranosyl-N-acetylglucosaminyl-diphospho-decaprenol beta-1,3/1,4-galactofuranosyltransferase
MPTLANPGVSHLSDTLADVVEVAAVVVAYNRCDLLRDVLTATLAQTRTVDRIHVVDNASTDDTSAMVADEFSQISLHPMPTNTGGAGGFAAGLAFALEAGAELVWLMDDDTVPSPTALEELVGAHDRYPGTPPAAVASRVLWIDGRDHPMNTPRMRPGVSRADVAAASAAGCIPVRSASFVSLLVRGDAVRDSGLPEADFFLWNDDFEFSTRLLRRRIGLYCPASVVEHRTRTFGAADSDPGDRFYFEVRNKVWTFTRSNGLAPQEKALYGASTVRRWANTFRKSADRRTLLSGLRRGLADGLRRGPRDVDAVMESSGIRLPRLGRSTGEVR